MRLRIATLAAFFAVTSFAQTIPDLHWRMIGPFRGGRTRAVAGVAGPPLVLYIAQVDGGVWRSDDAGRTWTPIFDAQPTQSVGAIAVAPSDPNVLYVGSGEGLHRPDLSVGNGVYKSTDAGRTWTHMGLDDAQQIPQIAVDPHDPNRLFVAVLGHPFGPSSDRGVYRSTDGGASWKRVLYKDENTGANDVAVDPQSPNVVYAALWESRLGPTEDANEFSGTGGGVFKSTDGGDTWTQLKNGFPANAEQWNLAIAPNNPRRLFAIVAMTGPHGYMSGEGLGLYRTDDAGATWTKITDDPRPVMLIGGGDLPVPRVDPRNPDVVYSASIVTVRSTDGGKTWRSIRGAPGGDDYQNVWVDPADSNVVLLGSDQGAIVTLNGGQTWSSWYNQPTAQLYHIGVTPTFPYKLCSGQQESGSVCINSRGDYGEITLRDWIPVGTIEYGYTTPDPLDADIVFGGGRDEVTRFRWSTRQVQNVTPIPLRGNHRVDRTEPLIFSPADPHILYYASNVLFKTSDRGESWQTISPDLTREHPGTPPSVGAMASKNPRAEDARGAIYAVAPGAHDVNTIWAGTDDGLLWVTRDGGAQWTNITPPSMTAWSKVTQIDAGHFDNDTAYASVSRLRVDDLKPYIYRTHDGGKTWQLIVNDLPGNAPVNAVREDPVRKGMLYAATETSMYVSFDDGDHWQSMQLNLPHSSMRDVVVYGNDLIVATHGRGFWVLDDIAPLRQVTAPMSNVALFQPADAIRVRRSLYTDTPMPPDEPMAENPPNGAIIDYYLGSNATGVVTIDILDDAGKVVRTFSSTDKPWITPPELEKQTIPPYWVKMPQMVSAISGMHRFVWDLHYPAPTALEHEYPISAVPYNTPQYPLGPRAMPGNYTVRLTANGQTLTAPLKVTLDPRVTMTAAQARQMFDLQTQLANMLTRSSEAVTAAKAMLTKAGLTAARKQQIQAITSGAQPAKKTEVTPQKQTAPPPEPPPTLTSVQSDVSTLYGQIDRADAAPTQAQIDAVNRTAARYDAVMKQWEALQK
ncbi:MAG TPA: glycoside hydrolase [Thermoanaerobaculia bacterium]|nr:glycoside hydrolase [Thermoanaerobaculia bacterium]